MGWICGESEALTAVSSWYASHPKCLLLANQLKRQYLMNWVYITLQNEIDSFFHLLAEMFSPKNHHTRECFALFREEKNVNQYRFNCHVQLAQRLVAIASTTIKECNIRFKKKNENFTNTHFSQPIRRYCMCVIYIH